MTGRPAGPDPVVVRYEMWAPALETWEPVEVNVAKQGRPTREAPVAYTHRWWEQHLSALAARGVLRNFTINGEPYPPT